MLPLTGRKCADLGNVCFRYYLHPKLHSPACFRLTLHHARFFPVIEYTSFCCCSVTKSCLTLCDSMNCSIAGFPVLHYLPEFAQTHVHWVSDTIQPSHPLSYPQSFPASESFPMSRLFTSGGQSIGASASAPVLLKNIQDWFPLGWTGWISLQSEGPSRVFSNTAVQKHQFFGSLAFFMVQLSHPYVEKP